MSGLWLLRRFAWEDQHPPGKDLRNAARDSVLRCAVQFGLSLHWDQDTYGMRWKMTATGLVQTGVTGWRSTALVTGPMPEALRLSGSAKTLDES